MRSQVTKIAILAMGGEGGGVLADWLVDMAERNGHIAQSTSVPGVAQRTGATIYYVEFYPRALAERDGARPVLALMPLPGDVDIVLASELMEAGRAVQRGLVTPERTLLVASTHRVHTIAEKSAMGDGRVDSTALLHHARDAARRFVGFDMAATAARVGSVTSAALFGALAATRELPFDREAFEATIRRSGVGIRPSLAAFDAAWRQAEAPVPPAEAMATAAAAAPAATVPREAPGAPVCPDLLARMRASFPSSAWPVLTEGLRRLTDYQDQAYAEHYLELLQPLMASPGYASPDFVDAAARHLALWMSYEDAFRVAELKTRAQRFDRVREEVGLREGQLLVIEEFMHPRIEEICDSLPAALGAWLLRTPRARRLLAPFLKRGRVVRTSGLWGFLTLYLIGRAKRWRRGTLRFRNESARIAAWLALAQRLAARDVALATELLRCQNLVKGYGDTHERGLGNFHRIVAALERGGAPMDAAALRALREAALADEQGDRLSTLLAIHA